MKTFKQHILEKLKVSTTNMTNDLFKHLENVKQINQSNYGRLKFDYISSEADFDKFYAYWFYSCESKFKDDPQLLSRLTEYIQLSFNTAGVFFIHDLETGDEITRWGDHPKEKEEPIAFPTAKLDTLEYFENIHIL